MNQMKWIELMRVRSSAQALQHAMPALQNHVREIEEIAGAETFCMQHALYDGDLAVVVVWRNAVGPQKTREGLMIAQRLRELGSTDHAVWVPAEQGASVV